MKRYLVFFYDQYYPAGPGNDFDKAFATLDEARAYLAACQAERRRDYAEIWEFDAEALTFKEKAAQEPSCD